MRKGIVSSQRRLLEDKNSTMTTTASDIDRPLLLFDIPWSTYKGIIDALPQQHFRHSYDQGTLEIFSRLIYGVPWESYEAILEAFGDCRFRHTYKEGTLEMMSPSEEHEWLKEFIGRLIEMAAYELDLPIKSTGSTTQRHPELLRGLEPDLSYYIQHESEVRGRRTSDSASTLPPDLVVEVEITHKIIDRLEAYATLKVAEVWRYRDKTVEFFALGESGEYARIETSVAVPQITSDDLTRFINMLDEHDENSVVRAFVVSLRKKS